MKTRTLLVSILATVGGFSSTGCTRYQIIQQTGKSSAFVVRTKFGNASIWHCDATAGDPVCFESTKARRK